MNNTNLSLQLRLDQASLNLLTSGINPILFAKIFIKSFTNAVNLEFYTAFLHLSPFHIARETKALLVVNKNMFITEAAADRFVPFFILICRILIRVLTLSEIRTALNAAGIEINPGPEQTDEPNPLSKLEIVTVNCNGLT